MCVGTEIDMIQSFQVTDHKTSKTHGALELAISETLHSYIGLYIKQIRPVVSSNHNNLFVTRDGLPMSQTLAVSAISLELASTGLAVEGRISFSLIRKSIITLVTCIYYLSQ